MAENRGKKFESVIKEAFLKVPGVSIDRLHDQTNGYKGGQNICDFIVYKKPYEYYIECKSVHGNTLPFSNITDTQWDGLLEKSQIKGVTAGILCWWIDHDQTYFIPIDILEDAKTVMGAKSLNIKHPHIHAEWFYIPGRKKRVFFDYDMEEFFDRVDGYSFQYEKE